MVFDISSRSLSDPLFPNFHSISTAMTTSDVRTTQKIRNRISQTASHAQRNLNWKSIIYIPNETNVNTEFFFRFNIRFFSQVQNMRCSVIFCHFMLTFILSENSFPINTKAWIHLRFSVSMIHLHLCLRQMISNEIVFMSSTPDLSPICRHRRWTVWLEPIKETAEHRVLLHPEQGCPGLVLSG